MFERPLALPVAAKAFYQDRWFLACVAAGVVFWLGLWRCTAVRPLPWSAVFSWRFAMLALWAPCWEELVFRGVVQGGLRQMSWGMRQYGSITTANAVTAGLFMLGHFWRHTPGWSVAVLVPGLLFGACRDRYNSIIPAIVLHAFYNAGYFIVSGLPH